MKNKENALKDFYENIKETVIYSRLTEHEKRLFDNVMVCFAWKKKKLYGNYEQRKEQLYMIYDAFLMGLGYTGGNWRQTQEEVKEAEELQF